MLLYKVSLIPTGYESYLYIVIFVPLAVVLAICLLITTYFVVSKKRYVYVHARQS